MSDKTNLINPLTLQGIYGLTTDDDIISSEITGYGITNDSFTREVQRLLVDTNASGGVSIEAVIKRLNDFLKSEKGYNKSKANELISIVSNANVIFNEGSSFFKTAEGTPVIFKGVIGNKKDMNEVNSPRSSIISVRSPFITPAKRNTNHCDLFMNSLPSVFASRMVPFLQVEFDTLAQEEDVYSQNLIRGPGLMRFLLGAAEVTSDGDVALLNGNTIKEKTFSLDKDNSYIHAGMEMFTTPQTLVNMDTLVGGGTAESMRYVSVLDPFRPFASIENAEITISPAGAGTYTYKKAELVIKLHDRSRLTEFSELIRPKAMKDVFVWLTYGWLAPTSDQNDQYAKFINNKMLTRECYKIINSSFTFDNVGQISINLSLWTQGASHLETKLISSWTLEKLDGYAEFNEIIEKIANSRKIALRSPPEGIGTDIRIYQLLDAAETGTFPDFDVNEVNNLIGSIEKLAGAKGEDLVKSLKKFTERDEKAKSKFKFKEMFRAQIEKKINEYFDELAKGVDPFFPIEKKIDGTNDLYYEPELLEEIKKAKEPPQTIVTEEKPGDKDKAKDAKPAEKKVVAIEDAKQAVLVSFGKLFSSLVIPALASENYKEIQIIFYALNEQCGPVSLCSIAEFPLDLNPIKDLYTDHTKDRGGDKVTINEFIQLVVNAQFLDKRAVGYGFRRFYNYYSSSKRELSEKNGNSKSLIDAKMALYVQKYGGFKLPNIDIYIETLHVNEKGETSEVPLIDRLNNPATSDEGVNKSNMMIKLHVYDKQLNPFKNVSTIIKADGTNRFASIDDNALKSEIVARRCNSSVAIEKEFFKIVAASEKADGNLTTVRDRLANTVPKITYGMNGSTIISANLSSKQDPLLSTVNMLRNERIKNVASPSGAGDLGLPMRVVPATLSLTTLGNPLACMAQQYFVDFNTGTTLDNLYTVTGLAHHISPGKFESSWTMCYADAYGQYIAAPSIKERLAYLEAALKDQERNDTKKK